MSLNVCPAATVAAPIEDVWELISNLARWWSTCSLLVGSLQG
ncbi:MAG TPA: hypothetical protein VN207_02225 [Ktedonobacteraceae bacterium]|nr:hypothetical protein [Ktedonobacteraceae bacterium]